MKVEIDVINYHKIMFWMERAAPDEVSGFGTVEVIHGETPADTVLFVRDVYLLPQKNTASSSDIDPEGLAKLEYEVYRKAQADGEETVHGLRWWWHSHVNMDAFWSSTDRRALDQLSKDGWMAATVFNLKEEERTCFISQGGDIPLMLDELEFSVIADLPDHMKEEWAKEFDEKVERRSPPVSRDPRVRGARGRGLDGEAGPNGEAGQAWGFGWGPEESRLMYLANLSSGDDVEVEVGSGFLVIATFVEWLSHETGIDNRWALIHIDEEDHAHLTHLSANKARPASDENHLVWAVHQSVLQLDTAPMKTRLEMWT